MNGIWVRTLLGPMHLGFKTGPSCPIIYTKLNDPCSFTTVPDVPSNPPPDAATARGGPWPPLQYASRPLGSLLYLSIRLYPSFSGPWTRHPAFSFLVFLFVLLHTAIRTASFLGLRCLTFFLYDQAIASFGPSD